MPGGKYAVLGTEQNMLSLRLGQEKGWSEVSGFGHYNAQGSSIYDLNLLIDNIQKQIRHLKVLQKAFITR